MRRFWSLVYGLGRGTTYALGLLALVLLILGPSSVGLAKVGDPLLAGRVTDAAGKATSLVAGLAGPVLRLANEGSGPALELKVEPGRPALKVNSDARVANLNADKLDGLDATQIVHRLTPTYSVRGSGPGLANQIQGATAECDDGDSIASGGVDGLDPTSTLVRSAPATDSRFVVQWRSGARADEVSALAVCYDFPPIRP